MADETLLNWANRQDDWVRDALRRHAQRPGFTLTDQDKEAIFERVKVSNDVNPSNTLLCEPLKPEHLPKSGVGAPGGILCSLGPVKNLNRLAADQKLQFSIRGLTVIYGENGSGKSGYCRIAKKICRSLSADDLLGNVFEGSSSSPAEVMVRYLPVTGSEPVEELWIDGNEPPDALGGISVFDSKNAHLYVNQKNQISFLPIEIALLESHGVHRREMDTELANQIQLLDSRLAISLPSGFSPTGSAAALLAKLEIDQQNPYPSEQEINECASITEEQITELGEVEIELANDPAVLALKFRRAKAALEAYLPILTSIEKHLSPAGIAAYLSLHDVARTTANAAALAATDTIKTPTLLEGVGGGAWQLMFDYARAYAASLSDVEEVDGLPATEDDLCLLCQQPLSKEGAARMTEFNAFVASTANETAERAQVALGVGSQQITNLQIPTLEIAGATLAEYADLSSDRSSIENRLMTVFTEANTTRKILLAASTDDDFAAVRGMVGALSEDLIKDIKALQQEAELCDSKAETTTSFDALKERRDALKDRQLLGQIVQTVLSRRADLIERSRLKNCRKLVGTRPVSDQVGSLRKSLVMDDLETRILREIEAFDLLHIPFKVSGKTESGASYVEIGLKSEQKEANQKVLSEGEQRALALACFLAEAARDDTINGFVIDDPVSSLDHRRIRRVARRLVTEAGNGRQVIVFTHNLHFYNELIHEAASANPQVETVRNCVRNSETNGFGLVSDAELPWLVQKAEDRIKTLRRQLESYDETIDFDTEDWRKAAKDFYSDLRETWERLVEEVLLARTVERFASDVKTQSLKMVVVEDEDHRYIYWAMKRVSERSGHDMPEGKMVPTPTVEDMQKDLNHIHEYRKSIVSRRKDAMVRRALLESPPVGEVL